jgi:hypothetical protein
MDLNFELRLMESSRLRLLKIMEQLPEEKLFSIPAGFNSNPLWQIGHCVASQQRLIYMKSGLSMHISEAYAENFKNGSSPATWTSKPDVNEIKASLLSTVARLKEDIAKGVFTQYESFTTGMGFLVNNHLEAIVYANFHEAEHTGNLKYLVKLLG